MTVGINDTNARVRNLQQRGYAFMPVQGLYSLVNSGMTDDEILHSLEQTRRLTVGSAKAGVLSRAASQAQLGSTARMVEQQRQAHLAATPGVDPGGAAPIRAQQQQVRQQKSAADRSYRLVPEIPV